MKNNNTWVSHPTKKIVIIYWVIFILSAPMLFWGTDYFKRPNITIGMFILVIFIACIKITSNYQKNKQQ